MNVGIVIVDYDPGWPSLFEAERRALQTVFDPRSVTIEHVGSTSVPGLGGKPTIDIMLGVRALAAVESKIPELVSLGYEYVPEYEMQLPERRYFRKPKARPRRYHLHAVQHSGTFWQRHLLFRDYLRRHPEAAEKYYQLKRQLAEQYGEDPEGYTEAKTDFIEDAIARARR